MLTDRLSASDLFDQLGLASDEASINRFIEEHKSLNKGTHLHEAPYWDEAQRAFLQEAIAADADWIVLIDELNVRLH
jgi:hypothetical protein